MFEGTADFHIKDEMDLIKKAIAFDIGGYPYNQLEDRAFEILNYLIFEEEIRNNPDMKCKFSRVTLMQGVAEKGIDVLLQNSTNKINGAIQCKKINAKVDRPTMAKEIIKFGLHVVIGNVTLIENLGEFTYYFSVSNDLSGPAIKLINNFQQEIRQEDELLLWIGQVIDKYKEFKELEASTVKEDLLNILESIKYEKMTSTNLNLLLEKYGEIATYFFHLKVVYVNAVKDIEFDTLLTDIYTEIENINEIKCSEIKHLLLNQVEITLTKISDLGQDDFRTVLSAIKIPFKIKRKFEKLTKFNFRDNFELIKHFVINVSLISLIHPDLTFGTSVGQAIALKKDSTLAYLHSSDSREYNVVILNLLKHFNQNNINTTGINSVIVDNVVADNCMLGQGSAIVDFNHIIPEISNVDIYSSEGKQEFFNLRDKYDFIYHCQFAFKYQLINSVDELMSSLNKFFGR